MFLQSSSLATSSHDSPLVGSSSTKRNKKWETLEEEKEEVGGGVGGLKSKGSSKKGGKPKSEKHWRTKLILGRDMKCETLEERILTECTGSSGGHLTFIQD